MDPLIERARDFAIRAHARIDQRRKYSGQPYDVHLKAVARLVAGAGGDPEMVAAAWLHDVVEDTPATLEELEREFGAGVARLVAELTDVSTQADGNRAARKAIDRAHLGRASPRAKTVKLADLIDNCRDICRHDERFARTFVAEASALIEVLGEGAPGLLAQARRTVGHCAGKIGLAELPPPDEALPAPGAPSPADRRAVALDRLMHAFSVQDIARPLLSFDTERAPEDLARALRDAGSDVAGLRRDGVVCGYLRRDADEAAATLCDFGPRQVLEGSASLSEAVEVLTRHEYGFVRSVGQVVGVVTRADLQSPIGRMWLFGMVTLIEMYAVQRIRARWPQGGWEAALTPARLGKARDLLAERARHGQQGELLDCLQFADKLDVLIGNAEELGVLGFPTRGAAQRVARDLQSLRNNLAHAQDVVEHDWPPIVRLTRRIEEALAAATAAG